MKSLFSRILLAQVVAVVLALVIVTVITRASLNRGFKEFLEKQETAVLQTLAPALEDVYERQGGWHQLRDKPQNWQKIWRQSSAPPGRPSRGAPRSRRGPPPGDRGAPDDVMEPRFIRWLMAPERGMLRERLFLLDADRSRIAGAQAEALDGVILHPVESAGETVGWIGFTPMGNQIPPDAQRFMAGQIRITAVSLAVALIVAAALAYLLARNMSRPVRLLGQTVTRLGHGEYQARAKLEARDEVGALAGNIDQLAETLDKNRTARQRWMADIAHELRTPIAILRGEIEALADGVRPADDRMSSSLQEEIEHLSALVDDLQTLALSDAGALNIHKQPVDLDLMLRQCSEAFAERLALKAISVDLASEDKLTLYADPQRIRQLLHNLFENTSRYVVHGGQVRIHLDRQEGRISLVLEDSGPGLDPDQIAHLFERFYRADSSRSRSGGGTGLGLSICRNIAEAHGGSIHAEPSSLGGLKIILVLPG